MKKEIDKLKQIEAAIRMIDLGLNTVIGALDAQFDVKKMIATALIHRGRTLKT